MYSASRTRAIEGLITVMKQKQKDDEGQNDSDRQGDPDGQNNTKGRTGGDKGILDTADYEAEAASGSHQPSHFSSTLIQ
jgi:hypothetical protein